MKAIESYEARTHWDEVLQDVKEGERYVILLNDEPIAELVPPQAGNRQARSKRAAEKLLRHMTNRALVDVDIKTLLDEGRD